MTATSIPDEVRGFVVRHIESLEQLEVLLLLARDPARCWDAPGVAAEMRTSLPSVEGRLRDLERRGLLAPVDGTARFRYAPATPDLESAVTKLAEAYVNHRYSIIELIFSKPMDHIRVFADAFRIRKEPRGDG